MSKRDSAKLQFYRVPTHHCCDSQCNQIVVQLTVDFGSLFMEIEADDGLRAYTKAPISRWILGHSIKWDARKWWSCVPRATTTKANKIVCGWVARARDRILSMTGREILAALESGKSVEVPIDKVPAVIK